MSYRIWLLAARGCGIRRFGLGGNPHYSWRFVASTPCIPSEQGVPGSRVARRARGGGRDRGVLEKVRWGAERRARPPACFGSNMQAGRSSESAIAAEAFMDNAG